MKDLRGREHKFQIPKICMGQLVRIEVSVTLSGKNWQLLTDKPVEFEK